MEDIQLIWTNCKTYNIQGSDIFLIAVQMEKHAKKTIEKYFKEKKKKGEKEKDGETKETTKKETKEKEHTEKKEKTENKDKPKSKTKTEGAAKDDDFENFDDDPTALLPFKERHSLCERIKKLTNDGLASVSLF